MGKKVCPCGDLKPWVPPVPASSAPQGWPFPSPPLPLPPACQGQELHPYPAVLGSEIPGPVGDLGFPIVDDLPEDRDLGQLVKAAVGIGWLQERDEAAGWRGQERRNV